MPPPADTRSRLVRFFEKYNPEKLSTVDKILESYAGKEDQLFEALTKKYGPEPEFSTAPTAPAAGDTRSRLVRFFEKYNPEKLSTVDKILESYAGKEEQLFEALTKKYGPEPASSSAAAASTDARSRLVRFFEKYNPEKLSTVDKILESYAGKEEQLFEALTKKYGPEPEVSAASTAPAPAGDTRSRLVRFFEKYNPEKLSTVDKIVDSYAGKEEQLFEALTKKYGPEPDSSNAVPSSVPPESDARSRLVRFFEKYNPEKLSTVDKILESYAGKEDQLFEALTKKYGPEPAVDIRTEGGGPAKQGKSELDDLLSRFPPSDIFCLLGEDEVLSRLVDRLGAAPRPKAPPKAAATATTPSVSTGTGATDSRSRLVRFFEKYNPEKLSTVDKILESYAGKEDQLFEALTTKYGAEPEAPAAPTAPAPPGDTRSRLVRFFEKYNPEKLPTVDKILESYAGKEDQLFEALTTKYGAEPEAPAAPTAPSPAGDTRSRLVRFFEKYNPEKLSTVDKILESYAGKEEQLFDALVTKYGPEPPMPEPAASVPTVPVSSTAPGEEKEDENLVDDAPESISLSEYLQRKRLTDDAALVALCGGPSAATIFLKENFCQPIEVKLRQFFHRYVPERLIEISALVKRVDDGTVTEIEVMKDLCSEYGPMPVCWEETSEVHLLRSHTAKVEDEQLSEGEEEPVKEEKLPPEVPEELVEGERIVADSNQAPPGEYSGDESKCYPAEEEHWLRLRFPLEQSGSMTIPSPATSGRTFTELVRDEEEDDRLSSPRSAVVDSADEGEEEQETSTARCYVDDKKGRPTGTLCVTCSALVARAFSALWTPVGPRHRKLISSTQTKNGYLEKLSGGKIGNKWQRRWMKVNDFGIHYFETNKASEKPKGHKTFTKMSRVIDNPEPSRFPKCNDTRFHHFVITVNSTQEPFCLRAATRQEKEEWVEFLTEALERLKVTMVGQDPNPARWRARVAGLKTATEELVTTEKEDNSLVQTLKERKEFLQEQLEQEKGEMEVLTQQNGDLAIQASVLAKRVEEMKAEISNQEKLCELRSIKAMDECIQIDEQREMLHTELETAAKNAESLEKEVQELKCQTIDAQVARNKAEARCRAVYEKWTRMEEKSSTNKEALRRK